MKALVLSGGEGSRLRPITHTNAKQLIPIANTPILFHALRAIADAGIVEVGIVVGHTADEVRGAVGDGSAFGLQVTYVPQEAPLGLAHAVLTAEEFVGDEPFVMYLGDNVLLEGLRGFVESFEEHRPSAQIFLAKVPEPERFGVAVLEGDHVTRLVEKPKEHISDLALVGVYLFDRSIVEAARTLEPSWRGELEITDAIQRLIDDGRAVRAAMVGGWWKDTGRPEDLLEANRMMLRQLTSRNDGEVDDRSRLEGTVVVERGAKVARCAIRGPVIIGEGTVVEDSVIGPDVSISYGCTVRGSEIEDSIVMEHCTIADVRAMAGSILGKGVDVRRATRPEMYRLIVGDQSQIQVY
ncbi:MAG TPA: glucose-1-phosphate thymidylyltransferase [Actinomycetota bacterium]|nr:glucose-1-phosphate thymidylyltransferase [Actinomycetota bacterium]